jgi:hypothetical protein
MVNWSSLRLRGSNGAKCTRAELPLQGAKRRSSWKSLGAIAGLECLMELLNMQWRGVRSEYSARWSCRPDIRWRRWRRWLVLVEIYDATVVG